MNKEVFGKRRKENKTGKILKLATNNDDYFGLPEMMLFVFFPIDLEKTQIPKMLQKMHM